MSSQPERAGRLGLAFSAGLLFSAGLVLSGMTQPLKVLGFLDITAIGKGPFPGLWDPTLAFVMGGAVCVTLLAFGWTHRMAQAPRFADQFHVPSDTSICHWWAVPFYLARVGAWWATAQVRLSPALF